MKILEMKICNACGIQKPITNFRKAPRCKSGHTNPCKDCESIKRKAKYRNDKKTLNEIKQKVCHIKKKKYEHIDWTESDTSIAKTLGTSISLIRYWRNKIGHPKDPTWKKQGFKSKKDRKNHWHRERRKLHPPSPEQKEKNRIRGMENFRPVWQEKGFGSKEKWQEWKESILINTPCSKCGGDRVHYTLKSGAQKGRRKIKCRRCANIDEQRRTQEWPGRYAEKSRRERQRLPDSYVACLLDIPVTALKAHPDLIEAKRDQIKILRELKPITRKNKHNAQEPE